MGLITATFFECGVRYERTTEEGTTKKVNELYIVDALTFTEAESRITEEMQPFVCGDFDVMTLKRTRYSEYDNSEGDKYYKAKSCSSLSTRRLARRSAQPFTGLFLPTT